ncbi:Transcriptional activator protein acu-15 [Colletotrichum fructicola]|uniref:Transcriptional activator protein acu-15 n=1 Tax=Colletotrichum fructicola (strain Nara gc5) TaxID=1213859 RepID=A0A7J6IFM9_COLFN|nr:Transcriptional activator protein [Colletotrichum fructicola]KAF4475163.1 Transcriptional activator protein acu-15 [Colletotrichum fructicola Nara gc5]KAI8291833.1 Transcriptional activator protein [Colletotrichum sp. SAR11_57]KAE9577682.1 Transcriptional activator protein [Colletotrichum fructicola]KAF4419649.1 Transcriptional activator protein acu-15 [Colletotrichum fructicola]KAF4894032.1 Transcriptional activator protein acu-15 [Colletotrichum fructicola]
MPGILPMKVIKVGTSSQSRIAQACDRCRSKKIRCDGIRPTCSQCANVGFECRTSDKLSRRAFPRGYTESLEERVRQLELEVRELKDLLDEKDEKIDMLSRMHGNHSSHRSPSAAAASAHSPAGSATDVREKSASPPKEDTFRVQASPLLLGVENSDSYFMGPSSGRAFIEAFKRKMQENGKSCTDFNPEAFLHIQGCHPLTPKSPDQALRVPPRLFSDRCVNVYFQEWAPLFPVLHKPTFLHIYEEFVSDPEKVKNNHKIAQLYLVFGIAALGSDQPDYDQIAVCEQQWQRAVEAVLMENTMVTLQCLELALLYCIVRADYKRLQHYKGIAVGLSHRLGLHQSQKRFSFGALTIETRKKVFWTLYTLDCFSGAILGLPKLLKEDDIHAEYPSDTDDEYVTEKGFQPTLPGEYTRLSSALALFRCCRILAKVMEKNYPAATSHELSLQQMSAMEAELDEWCESLPAHLKLNFVQDKPSTDVTGSRSPLLALAYYYTRTLIYRPAVGSSLGHKAAPALLSIGESSKHIVQIVQLLEERNMTFSFCLNKTDTLMLCGMTLLYQSFELKQDSKMMKDVERLVNGVIKILTKAKAPGSFDLKRVASMLVRLDEPVSASSQQISETSMPAPQRSSPPAAGNRKKSPQQTLGRLPSAAASESDLIQQQEKMRRMTMPSIHNRPELYRSRSRPSFDNLPQQQQHDVSAARREQHRLSMSQIANRVRMSGKQNLDYLSLSSTPNGSSPPSPTSARLQQHLLAAAHQTLYNSQQPPQKIAGVSTTEWEALLGSMDGGLNNVYDAIYGGGAGMPPMSETTPASTNLDSWSPDSWDLASFNIGDFGTNPAPPQSVLSVSEESLSSGEDLASDLNMSVSSLEYRNALLASCSGNNDGLFEGLDVNYGL